MNHHSSPRAIVFAALGVIALGLAASVATAVRAPGLPGPSLGFGSLTAQTADAGR